MRLPLASSFAATVALVALGGGPSLADGTIAIEEARYGGNGRFCSAMAFFSERCAGRESCTIEITPEAEPCEVPGGPVGSPTVQLRYGCGGSTNAVAASGRSLLRLGCSSVVVRSRRGR